MQYTALVVDDDLYSLEEMYEYLSVVFSNVYKAANAEEALNIIASKKPDIIFTDIIMPNVDGFDLIQKIKENNRKLPVVIVSAYDDKEKLFKAIKLDIVDYLVKPLTSAVLKNTINLCMKRLNIPKGFTKLNHELVWDNEKSVLLKDNDVIKLTLSEQKILKMLLKVKNKPVSSVTIFNYLWGDTDKEYNPKNIRNTIFNLRKKLGSHDLIKNVYGSKYMITLSENQ
ncbi:MAG: response regulator [Sulfurospirillaceae bacterium]|nr:response regulator [Sulfurospirillaceae bacterium]